MCIQLDQLLCCCLRPDVLVCVVCVLIREHSVCVCVLIREQNSV